MRWCSELGGEGFDGVGKDRVLEEFTQALEVGDLLKNDLREADRDGAVLDFQSLQNGLRHRIEGALLAALSDELLVRWIWASWQGKGKIGGVGGTPVVDSKGNDTGKDLERLGRQFLVK